MTKILIAVACGLVALTLGHFVLRNISLNSSITPLNAKEAEKIAIAFIQNLKSDESLEILEQFTEEHDFGFVFYYNSRKYKETGDIRYMAVGAGPLIVDRRLRKAIPISTSIEPAEAISEYGDRWRNNQ